MPATAQGPATCRSGGEYKKIQSCPGQPKCIRDDHERTKAQAQPKGCMMCSHEWVFIETGGSVHRPPERKVTAPALVPRKEEVKASAPVGVKLKDPKWGHGGVTADQKILVWLKSIKVASPAQMREAFPDYTSGTIRNALIRLKKDNLVRSPKFGYWIAR